MMELSVSRKAIDNVGLRYRDRCEQVGDRALIQDYRLFRSDDLTEGFKAISKATANHPLVISGRLKRTDTLIRKLRREPTMKLTFMADVVGFRLLVQSPSDQYKVRDLLCDALQVKAVKDYVDAPPETGYQGMHIIGQVARQFPGNEVPSNLTYEIQIRTPYQHFWSTTSESMGEQVKEGGGTPAQRDELVRLAKRIREFEALNPSHIQEKLVGFNSSPIYILINYDKSRGRMVTRENFGSDLVKAISFYKYLEDEHSRNYNNEVVLLITNEQERTRLSHTRYYAPKGRPAAPSELSD